jgi:ABC-type branched-subunit amino acid transport system ATPase component/branched-subunit amino acid ABC-type transport system permease component
VQPVKTLIDLVASGAVTGAIYALMAAGLVLTYQTTGMFNFAHGAVAFTVAYLYYELHVGMNLPIVPSALLAVMVFAPLLGLALDRMLLRRLAHAPVSASIVGTIGLLVALPNLAYWLVEPVANGLFHLDLPINRAGQGNVQPPGIGPSPARAIRIVHDLVLNTDQIAVLVCATLAAALLWFVLQRTRVGLEIRAVVDREGLARLRGIDSARTSAVAWVLTMILAGLGGVLIAPLFALDDTTITFIVLGSLAAVAFARLRSVPAALVGGVVLGVIANLVAGYSDNVLPPFLSHLSGLRTSVPYVLTILLLTFWVAPRAKGRRAGSVADDVPRPDHRVGLSAARRRIPWIVTTVLLIAYALRLFPSSHLKAGSYEQGVIALGLVMALIFLSFVVVTGLGGMVSLAQATFVTAGGLAAGWALNHDWGVSLPLVASHGQLNFLLAGVLGALVAALAAVLVALPVRTLAGASLAICSLALAFAADVLVFGQDAVNHGGQGWAIRAPTFNPPGMSWLSDLLGRRGQPLLDLGRMQDQILILLVLFGAVALAIRWLEHSATGRAILAVRSSEVGAEATAINAGRTRVLVFAISGAIAGFGGAFLGIQTYVFTDRSATPYVTLFWLALAVTFGVRRSAGAFLAGMALACSPMIFHAVATNLLPNGAIGGLFSSVYFVPILSGLGAINLAQDPDGILSLAGRQRLEKRRVRSLEVETVQVPTAASAATPSAPSRRSLDLDGALVVEGLVAGYGDTEVLHGVDLFVAAGSIVALVGANGAGKSTFCAAVGGLVSPTSGRVLIGGEDITAWPAHARARRGGLQLVPEARGVFPGLSVEDNLTVLLPDEAAREIVFERFPLLRQRRKQSAGLLSGGEQQLLGLAPALIEPPKVLIADEPTLGLAPLVAKFVIDAIRELREQGAALLLVEEHPRNALQVADSIAYMDLGRIIWCGPREEADLELLAATYLGGGHGSERLDA